ncbi:MAG TPA: hypothetical protein VIX86_04615 [Streptosporangiaceae bacterium]
MSGAAGDYRARARAEFPGDGVPGLPLPAEFRLPATVAGFALIGYASVLMVSAGIRRYEVPAWRVVTLMGVWFGGLVLLVAGQCREPGEDWKT